jgi:hypothetical protein
VWLGNQPMEVNEGAKGDQVMRVELDDDVDLDDFEVVVEGSPYREWCVPAALINEHATVTLMSESAVDELQTQLFLSRIGETAADQLRTRDT